MDIRHDFARTLESAVMLYRNFIGLKAIADLHRDCTWSVGQGTFIPGSAF
jgi:hypothetical protein